MGQVLLFLAAVNSVPWSLYFLLRDAAAEGEVWALFAWLLPTVWSPTIVALLLTRWADGPTGIRAALGRLRYPRDGGRSLAIAAAVPATATATAVFVARATGEGAPFIPLVAVPFVIAMQCLTGAVGEELGWRGFLVPRLRMRYGALPAVWAAASLWSVWHVLLVLLPRNAAAIGATAAVSSSRGVHRSLPGSCVHGGPRLCTCHDGRSPVGQHHDGAERCGRLVACVLVDVVRRVRRSRCRWYGQVSVSSGCDPLTALPCG